MSVSENNLCWCKLPGERRVQKHNMHTGRDYYTMGTTEIAKFCPDCGEKITAEKKPCQWCEAWGVFQTGVRIKLESKDAEFLSWFISAAHYLITRGQPMTECPGCGRKI